MPIWLCRVGRYGEFENKLLEDGKVYCTWDNLSESIMQFHTKQDLHQYFVDNNRKNDDQFGKLSMSVCLLD